MIIMLVPAFVVHIGDRHKICHYFMMSCKSKCCASVVLTENMSTIFISNKREANMTSQGYVTTGSLKQSSTQYLEGHFLSACVSQSSAHSTLNLHTVN